MTGKRLLFPGKSLLSLNENTARMKYNSYIDVHHHYNPLPLLKPPQGIGRKVVNERGKSVDISRNLEAMDKLGIEKSILSYPAWFPSLTEQEYAVLCTAVNECYADLVAGHSCLGAFALLPVSKRSEGVLEAMEYALDTLQLTGIVLPTDMHGLTLCNLSYTEIFRELDNRNATVFLHPAFSFSSNGQTGKNDYEVMTEVTKITCELVFNKIPRQYPNIRFILPCGGGNTSFFFQEIEWPGEMEKNLAMAEDFKRLYYDTAFPNRSNLLKSLKQFADKSHILFGSNFPSASLQSIQQGMDDLEQVRYREGVTLAEYTRQNAFFIR